MSTPTLGSHPTIAEVRDYYLRPEILAELGRRIRRYRLQQNLSQADLARDAGLGTRTIRNVESGK